MAMAKLKVIGMSCDHCVRTVTEALNRVDGVKRAEVDLASARAMVDYDADKTDARALANAVMDEGYTAEEMG